MEVELEDICSQQYLHTHFSQENNVSTQARSKQ